MTGMIGADPQDLESLAGTMAEGAKTLDAANMRLKSSFQHAKWHGDDAQRAKADFAGKQAPQLSRVADILRDTAKQLRRDAQEQVRASAADGGAGPGGFGGFKAMPLPAPVTLLPPGAGGDASLGGVAAKPLPDKDSFGNGKTSFTGESSTKGPLGTIPGMNKGIDGEVGISSTVSLEKSSTKDGDTYTVTSKVSLNGSAGIDLKRWGIEGSVAAGTEVSYQITVPHGVDPNSINPNDPASWPPGTSLKIDANQVSGYGMEVKYGAASAENSLGSSHGTSRIMTHNADGTVTVMEGPTEAMNQSFKLGLGIDGIKVSIGVNESLSDGQFHSVTFDPSTAEGAAALDRSAFGGALPTADAPGLKDIVQVSDIEYNHSLNAAGKFFNVESSSSTGATSHSYVTTTRGDGTSEMLTSVRIPGYADLTIAQNWDSSGHAEPDNTVYDYKLSNISDLDAQVLNLQKYSGIDSGGGFNAGDDVTVTFTQQQMEAYHAAAVSEHVKEKAGGPFLTGIGQFGDYDLEQFPLGLQKAGDGHLINQIYIFSGGGPDSTPLPFPGTVAKQ